VGGEVLLGGPPVWFAPSSPWGLVQRSKSDRDPTTGNGFVPKYFDVEGMQFSTFPAQLDQLSILYCNANLLDPDLALIGPSASACTSIAAAPARSSSGATKTRKHYTEHSTLSI
jgi:hypothetical protein